MNVHALSRAAVGTPFRRSSSAGGPLTVTIDHAGSLFGFQRGTGAISDSPDDPQAAKTISMFGVLGAFTAIALGIWLFYRGVTSPKKLNLQTFGGFFLFSNGLGNLFNLMNPERAAVGYAALAGGQFVRSSS